MGQMSGSYTVQYHDAKKDNAIRSPDPGIPLEAPWVLSESPPWSGRNTCGCSTSAPFLLTAWATAWLAWSACGQSAFTEILEEQGARRHERGHPLW